MMENMGHFSKTKPRSNFPSRLPYGTLGAHFTILSLCSFQICNAGSESGCHTGSAMEHFEQLLSVVQTLVNGIVAWKVSFGTFLLAGYAQFQDKQNQAPGKLGLLGRWQGL